MALGMFLPEHISARVARLPAYQLGVHRVGLRLRNGLTYFPVLIAWETEIVRVNDSSAVPFDPADIVDVFAEPV